MEVSKERGNGLSALPASPAPAPKKHGSFSILVIASAKINLDCLLALFVSCYEPETAAMVGVKGNTEDSSPSPHRSTAKS